MSKPVKSILYLSPYFWPEEIGSAPYCTDLARFLEARGYAVTALAFRPHYPSIEAFGDWAAGARDRETLGGIEIERVPVAARGGGGFRERVRNDLGYFARVLGGALRGRYQADTVVAYVPSVLTLFGARAVKARRGCRIVAVVHDIESGLAASLGIAKGRGLLGLMRFVERLGLNFADEVVVLTPGMEEELRRLGCRRPITVLSIWGGAEEEAPIDPAARPVLMYSGNFGKKQNLEQLIPLLDRLSKSEMAVDVVMRGEGSERARIEDEIAARDISNVTFLPLAPADAFPRTLRSANIHLVPQARNVANYALPSKLFSIMSVGRPFLCLAEPGSPLERLAEESGAGLCVAPGDDESAFRQIAHLLASPDRQREMGANGLRYVARNMNRADIFPRYEKIIGR